MSEAVGKFCKLWPEELASLLGQMGVAGAAATGDAPRPMETTTQELLASGVHARFVGGGALKGELAIVCETSTALSLAQAFMSEPLEASVGFGNSHRDAFLELLRQVAGVVATDWNSEVGRDVLISFHSAAEPPFAGATEVAGAVHREAPPSGTVKLVVDRELTGGFFSQTAAPPAAAGGSPNGGAAGPRPGGGSGKAGC